MIIALRTSGLVFPHLGLTVVSIAAKRNEREHESISVLHNYLRGLKHSDLIDLSFGAHSITDPLKLLSET